MVVFRCFSGSTVESIPNSLEAVKKPKLLENRTKFDAKPSRNPTLPWNLSLIMHVNAGDLGSLYEEPIEVCLENSDHGTFSEVPIKRLL